MKAITKKYIPLPEKLTPHNYISCTRCTVRCHRNRVIWGEGNYQAPLMLILDNPGAREDKENLPFVCGTRQTLFDALEDNNISENDVFITYLLKCRPLKKYDKEESRNICFDYLREQILEIKPKVLVCLGTIVIQSLIDSTAEVKKLRGQWVNIGGIATTVTYHPLACRRRPNLYKYLVSDLKAAYELLKFPKV